MALGSSGKAVIIALHLVALPYLILARQSRAQEQKTLQSHDQQAVVVTFLSSLALARKAYGLHQALSAAEEEKQQRVRFLSQLGKVVRWSVDTACPKHPTFAHKREAEAMILGIATAAQRCAKHHGTLSQFMMRLFQRARKKYTTGCKLQQIRRYATDTSREEAAGGAAHVFELSAAVAGQLVDSIDGDVGDVDLLATVLTKALTAAEHRKLGQTLSGDLTDDASSDLERVNEAQRRKDKIEALGAAAGTALSVISTFLDPTGIAAADMAAGLAASNVKQDAARRQDLQWECAFCPVLSQWCENEHGRAQCGPTKARADRCDDIEPPVAEVCPKELITTCELTSYWCPEHTTCHTTAESRAAVRAWEDENRDEEGRLPPVAAGPSVRFKCHCDADSCANGMLDACVLKSESESEATGAGQSSAEEEAPVPQRMERE